jgi:hypothetical protein
MVPLRIRRSMRGTSTWFGSCSIAASGTGAPIWPIWEIISTDFGSCLLASEIEDGELSFAGRVNDPLFIPQIAA